MKDLLFRQVLPEVSKPARYTGGEYNMFKKDWASAGVKMALAFPDVYEIGMSHVGGKILYGLVNETSPHILERVFAPWPDMEAEMRRFNIPLYSLESFQPLDRFDVVGFSLQYELSITNVLNMLDLGHIPLWSWERGENCPLIIAGGPVAFNPEPFAGFFDLFVIGDGEEALLQLLDTVAARADLSRAELLLELAQIEGFYVPSLYDVVYDDENHSITRRALHVKAPASIRKRAVKNLDQAYFPVKPIVSYLEVVHDRAVLEVMRGCQGGCRFCQAGMVYRPVRERNVESLTEQAGQQLKCTGYDEISLTSLSTLDYSGIKKLVDNITVAHTPKGIGVSLPSLRVDRFSIELAEQVQKVRKTTLTLAPEAGSQRLRDIINKNVTSEQLYLAAEAAFKSGWLAIKLYFMIGLPGENEEDLEELLCMLKEVKRIGKQFARRPPEIRASCAIFVPKAHTPFQWQPQVRTEDVSLKKAVLTKHKIKNIKLSFHDSPTSRLEGLIARGDRRMSPLLFKAWQNGCRFDSWTDFFNYENWRKALDEADFDLENIIYRHRAYDEDLPWDFIDIGVSKDYLQEEAERSLAGETTADCRYDGCNNCNVCTALKIDLDIKETGTCV
ncbi:MAG: TIGR03960 family B12-binding radical SAM protein [Syntrophomonadaceae bacterium]|jgi:radical SAM family uncharacterized protein|nr:TIGR03960 family B12-binding radical SAM protein [Syntrophomonadaceae bacterium]